MEGWRWLVQHAYTILQGAGIIGGLFYTALGFQREGTARRMANQIALTNQHRDIWEQLYERPELGRILEPQLNLKKHPPTRQEILFVNLLILHLNNWVQAIEKRELDRPEGLRKDVREFFALPIPRFVWNQQRRLHNESFVNFMNSCLLEKIGQ